MLSYILAITVLAGSFVYYMSAFFFPEVHRKGDFIWSGVGLFYALVLWFCAGRMTGAVLLGQIASVALVGWFGWQTLQLRRQVTPSELQTPVSEETLQAAASPLRDRWPKFFQRQPKPTIVIDRKPAEPKVEAPPAVETAPTPAVVVEAPVAAGAVTPEEREMVEPVEAIAPQIAPDTAPEIAPSEEAIAAALAAIPASAVEFPEAITPPVAEDLPAAAALSGGTAADAREIPASAVEFPAAVTPPVTEDLPAEEQLPAAAALSGATAEDDDFDLEEGFEPEPEEPKIEAKASAAKAEPKEKLPAKPTTAKKGGGGNLLAPVTGLVTALSSGIGGLLSKINKPKPQPAAKQSEAKTPEPKPIDDDSSELIEDDEFPLEVEAALEIVGTPEAPAETAAQAGESAQEEAIASVETTETAAEAVAEVVVTVEESAPAAETIAEVVVTVEESAPAAETIAEVVVTVEESAPAAETIAEVVVTVEESTPAAEAVAEVVVTVEESAPELIRPNPPAPELVEAARESAPETAETAEIPVEEIAAEAELAPPAEAAPEAEPEPAAAIEVQPVEEPAAEPQTSEEQGFAQLMRPQRADEPALVETAKKSAEAPIQTPPLSEGEDSQPG